MNITLKRIQSILFYLLLFLLPSNLGYHFILPSSYVQGILVDYLIPTLYLTDILIFGLFGFWLRETIYQKLKIKHQNYRPKLKKFEFYFVILLLAVCFLILNISRAVNPMAAAYKWLKLAEMGWLFWYLNKQLRIGKFSNCELAKNTLIKILSLSVLWQSTLAIAQWIKQGSVFGYWFFGEQPYTIAAAGIKTVSWFGQLKAVPMGTFPHPNVLAAFLALSLLEIIKCCFLTCDRMLIFNTSGLFSSYRKLITYSLYLITTILGTIALFLTFSLPAWGVLITIILKIKYQRLKTQIKNKILFAFILVMFPQVLMQRNIFSVKLFQIFLINHFHGRAETNLFFI